MTGGSGAKDVPHTLNDEERAPGKDVFSGLGEEERREVLIGGSGLGSRRGLPRRAGDVLR